MSPSIRFVAGLFGDEWDLLNILIIGLRNTVMEQFNAADARTIDRSHNYGKLQ